MLYYLFRYLDRIDFPGARMFQYISFRSALAVIGSLLIALFIGKRIINYLRYKQIGETVRDLGLEGQMQKKGTPTMGGIIILVSLLIPTLLLCELSNVYVLLLITTTVWLGFVGFMDDYIKVFKKDKKGMEGKFKILGQITLGIIVGLTFYFSPQVVVRERANTPIGAYQQVQSPNISESHGGRVAMKMRDVKTTSTTIPFIKNHEFHYSRLVGFLGKYAHQWIWLAM
ncbi:MAG TPA: phospho-N-acetylmuramoyl-pentapeptide-transferase, partial [Bacteroidales bacterium]